MPDPSPESHPGTRLRAARRAAGISARDLGRLAAESLGRSRPISESAVRNQENGTNGIPIELANTYGTILDTTAAYIYWGDSLTTDLDLSSGLVIARATPEWAKNTGIDAVSSYPFRANIHLGNYEDLPQSLLIIDHSDFEPLYPFGSVLVACKSTLLPARSGDLVLLRRGEAGSYERCVQRLTLKGSALQLTGIGRENLGQKADLVPSQGVQIRMVVIGAVLPRPSPDGKPLEIEALLPHHNAEVE